VLLDDYHSSLECGV